MAAATSTPLSLSSSSAVIDSKASRQCAAASSQFVTFPTLPPRPVQSQSRTARTTTYYRKTARNVAAMATGEAQTTEVVEAPTAVEAPRAVAEEPTTTEVPEIVKTIQEKWDKVEDKYAVISLAAAGVVVLWGSAGLLYAIDRLPLIPGVLELVGIGYTVWFAYKNIVFKPNREALIEKIGDTYKEIIGSG